MCNPYIRMIIPLDPLDVYRKKHRARARSFIHCTRGQLHNEEPLLLKRPFHLVVLCILSFNSAHIFSFASKPIAASHSTFANRLMRAPSRSVSSFTLSSCLNFFSRLLPLLHHHYFETRITNKCLGGCVCKLDSIKWQTNSH